MKSVILIGDSIRMGYQPTVIQELKDAASVSGSESNGGDSRRVLEKLAEHAIAHQPDIIHVNCGLHDIKKAFGQSEAQVPLAEYEQNVRQILQRLRAETKATVIWAATTPVNQDWHHKRKGFDRFSADVDAYNAVATRVAKECGVPIDDLFAAGKKVVEAGELYQDGVHYTQEGYRQLGVAVVKFIRQFTTAR